MSEKSEYILALDLASSTGWAALLPDGKIAHGHLKFKGSEDEKYVAFAKWLSAQAFAHGKAAVIVYEQPMVRFQSAVALLYGFRGILRLYAKHWGIGVFSVHTATLKKHATTQGNADKAMMKQCLNFPIHGVPTPALDRIEGDRNLIKSDDEIDAIWVLNWYLSSTTKN